MSKSDRKGYNRPIAAHAYAAIAAVEGLQLSNASRKRLAKSKALSPDERRAEIMQAYAANLASSMRSRSELGAR